VNLANHGNLRSRIVVEQMIYVKVIRVSNLGEVSNYSLNHLSYTYIKKQIKDGTKRNANRLTF